MSKLMILGAGGHGKVVAEVASLMNKWSEIVFFDDNVDLKKVNGFKVVDDLENCKKYKMQYENAFVAIGNNKLRIKLINDLSNEGFKIPLLIHPFTCISNKVKIDEGTVVMAGAVINANSLIGKGCIINTSCSIDHDCILKDGVHISPGVHIGGTTQIGKFTWICIGSSISNNINIGHNSVIAAGATVVNDIENYALAVGTPAKNIKVTKTKGR
ncbi:acetyltransferase [Clostridium sp. D2Q-11]|uniref:Acetyltransferase n=1 Tax=Anaeromonas frigoriresistens TaxID=2683708 RepID=A0A942UVC7_9FIRM|nr:acetyltransferase [Anaeromonas frigoriresistens]MBS4539278.1 acetyltransferase [Anaeromonas frigoriresistens]